MRQILLSFCACSSITVAAAAADETIPEWAKGEKVDMTLDNPKIVGHFVASDPAVWKHVGGEERKGFLQLQYDRKSYKSNYTPKYRSPVHIAILKQYALTDFVMDVELMSTTELYGHQDLCLFFGIQSSEKYYYVHLAPAPDANAHNVFVVNNAMPHERTSSNPRRRGSSGKRTTGTRSASCVRPRRAKSKSISMT